MANLVLYRVMVVVMIIVGCLPADDLVAQLRLKLESVDRQPLPAEAVNRNTFKSRQDLLNYIEQLPVLLQARGYLAASVDSVAFSDSLTTAYVFLGSAYKWSALRIRAQDWPLLRSLGYNSASFHVAAPNTFSELPLRIVNYYQNNGHPFAKVQWDSVSVSGNEITAALHIDPGPLYKLDSIGMHGTARISRAFLERHFHLPEDGVYRQDVLDRIDQRLLELPYLEQAQPWNITMLSTGYVINFYLQPKRSNHIDALVGFLPSHQQNGGRLLLTVDANVLLRNALGNGETIDFSWEQIQPKSPRLNLLFQQPYIFGSRFGLDAAFQLYKKDSSFLNIWGSAGVQYTLDTRRSARVLLQTQRTNLLDVDTLAIRFSKRLPDIIDMNVLSLGVEYLYQNTNYRFNPRRGTDFSLSVLAGTKNIRRNNAITQIKDGVFDYNSLYDSLQLNSYQLRMRLGAAQYFPIARQATIKTGIQAGWIASPQIFRNEMFQVGGYRLLRGFDEESIFTNGFAVATLEYRYLVGLNSFFFLFTDLGYTNTTTIERQVAHNYIGLGGGMAFETRQGLFNISYAVGKRDDLRLDLRQSKIHLGFTSFF